jgi:MSHA biogenesis protein MshM
MYADYFQLEYPPFDLTPDTRQYTAMPQHADTLMSLQYCISAGHGFLKISGDIGMGKTLLCRMLIDSLDDSKFVIYLPSPPQNVSGIQRVVAQELGIKIDAGLDDDSVVREIYLRLIDLRAAGRTAVVVLDESQGIGVEALESLRLLASLDTRDSRLLQVVLFGSNELDDLLMRPELAALRQRIVLDVRLKPLSAEDARAYLLGRVVNAGGRNMQLFDKEALGLLLKHAKGNPRVINVVANLALVSAYANRHQRVLTKDVCRALTECSFQVGKTSAVRRVMASQITAGLLLGFGVSALLMALAFAVV